MHKIKTTTAEKLHNQGKLRKGDFYELKFSDHTSIYHFTSFEPFTFRTIKEGIEVVQEDKLYCFYHPVMNITHKNFGDYINIIIQD